jgi:glycosyltransferase involved in cell wall biosynthesis
VAGEIVILLSVPTPPPFSGPEINGEMLLRNGLGPGVRLLHVRPNVQASNRSKGTISWEAVATLFRMWLQLLSVALRNHPQVMYLYLSQNRTGFVRDAVLILTARALGSKVVAHVRGSNFENFYRSASFPLRYFARFVVGRLARVILLAERFKKQFAPLLPPDRITVMYNAVDDRFYQMLADRPGLPTGCTFLFIGHLSRAKGFEDLVEAIPVVLEAVADARFVIAGEWLDRENNILRDELGQPLSFNGPSIRVRWNDLCCHYGSRLFYAGVTTGADKVALFHRSHVLVLPSYSEGFPMVVLEAMAAALSLIVTPVGALPEVLVDGVNARFVLPGKPRLLADAMVELGLDPHKRRRMGEHNRQLVKTRFTFEPMRQQLRQVLQDVAVSGTGGNVPHR